MKIDLSPAIDELKKKALEDELITAFLNLQSAYGHAAAIKAVGRLLVTFPGSDAPGPAELVLESLDLSPDSDAESTKSEPVHHDIVIDTKKPSLASALAKSKFGNAAWKHAVQLAVTTPHMDPWASRKLHLLPMEHCVRYRYLPLKKEWARDDVLVKVENKPFAAGAMRECFAMKKLSTFFKNIYHDWKKAQNCVTKRYKKHVKKSMYFTDVLVQMDAKWLSEEYNKTDPPKPVDVMEAVLVEFKDRPHSPIYSVEMLMEGDYVKYNSNSGFVLGDNLLRHTPQAFSHFTYSLTKGQKICVDIQGVGDLYTDPQIHTIDGTGYGEGDLGLRGMALFFRSHECNPLCHRLNLAPFARCEIDIKSQGYTSESSTVSKADSIATMGKSYLKKRNSAALLRYKMKPKNLAKPYTKQELLDSIGKVNSDNKADPDSFVHLEVAKVYSEVVMLPELSPLEDPDDALKAAVFHTYTAAEMGNMRAICTLARIHTGLDPVLTQTAHLVKTAKISGDVVIFPELAFAYAKAAAKGGIVAAMASVAHTYATAQGIGEGFLTDKDVPAAMYWYRRVLAELTDGRGLDSMTSGSVLGLGQAPWEVDEEEDSGDEGNDTITEMTPSQFVLNRPACLASTTSAEPLSSNNGGCLPEDFLSHQKQLAEDEAYGLPGTTMERYEILAALGDLVLAGGTGSADGSPGDTIVVNPDPAKAAELYNEAAEAAEAAMKAKMSMKYYEKAAVAEGMCEGSDI